MERLTCKDLMASAEAEVRSITIDEAEALGAGDAVLVDIRDPRELEREGCVPGAKHAPRGMLEFWIDPDSKYHKPWFGEDRLYVFFCAGGMRSLLAAQIAQRMGLKTASMTGGFGDWKKSGKPVEAWKPKAG